jgi:O-antigen/teichoic acid export membrane protein
MIRLSLLLGGVMALSGTAFGPWLIVQIFGDRYAQAGMLIGPVLWMIIPFTVRSALSGILMAEKKDSQIFWGVLMGAAFFVITISEAVTQCNAAGAIISALAAMSLTAFYFIFVLRQSMAIDLRSALMKPGGAVVATVVVFYALSFAGPLVSLLGAFAILFFICYWFKCLTLQEIIWLKNSFWLSKKNLF